MTGIIGAMESEVSRLLGQMESRTEETVCGVTFYRGFLAGQETVVARAGVGKVNAALCAQTMILRYAASPIINTGVAGALSPALKQGDAVVASSLAEYDMDTTPLGDPAGLLTVAGENLTVLPADPAVGAALLEAAKAEGLYAVFGKIASGDRFVASHAEKERIRSLFGADACEMEGAAIAHACHAAKVPCGILRVMSDAADGGAATDFPTFVKGAADQSANILLRYLASLPRSAAR